MKPIIFKNARLIDPSRDLDETGTIILKDTKILAAGARAQNQGYPDDAQVIDCAGKAVLPGLVDMRTLVGEPGAEQRETIASASLAAASGGVTSFVMMPDTTPVIDNVALVKFILHTARETAITNVYPTAAITRNLEGSEMTEFGLLREAGAIALTEGQKTLENPSLIRRAMTYARDFDIPLMHETQDRALTGHGVMHEGLLASWLGLTGIPQEAEVIPLERDLRLAKLTKARYHAAQLSCAISADAIKRAKDNCCHISAGVSINHLLFNDNDVGDYQTAFRLSPPLRPEDDRLAMVEAVRDGTIDVVVSSHHPQGADSKKLPFEDAKAGAIGLETLLAAALRLYHNETLSLKRIVEVLATNPARLLGIDAGTLKPGAKADVIVVDLDEPWVVSSNLLRSRSKNTVFENTPLQGRVQQTVVGGKTVFQLSH